MTEPAAYMIVTCAIDPSKKAEFTHYVSHARPLFAAYGGKPAGQYAVASSVYGDGALTHVIVMAFPNADAIRSCLTDPAYVALIPARSVAFPTLQISIGSDFDPRSLMVPAS